MIPNRSLFIPLVLSVLVAFGQREALLFDHGWEFALGDASSQERDFGCGTEYFTYLTKAASIHNEGPYSPKFDASKWGKEWQRVDLPHDWVVDLPFDSAASHSHGYKAVGYKYPENSVGWYRKTFTVPAEDLGRHISLRFDGIFRDAKVWVNGFYLGSEPSGYADQIYDISEYLNYGGENLVTVRCDASTEEGWFYEGAGIYRHAWLEKASPVHVADNGVFVKVDLVEADDPSDSTGRGRPSPQSVDAPQSQYNAVLTIRTEVKNDSHAPQAYSLTHNVRPKAGSDGRPRPAYQHLPSIEVVSEPVLPSAVGVTETEVQFDNPTLWDLDNPVMYEVVTDVIVDGEVVDTYVTPFGIRKAEFDPDRGFLLNGKPVKLKGVNMHQDHAGVGSGIPDGLHIYRLKTLKDYGVNAYRSSHNPASPAVLDACDSLGILVIDENRLTGVNDHHIRLLERMIRRDRNHPSVILYSVGNEEWGIEWKDYGERIVRTMRDHCHRLDPSRPMTVASSSGPTVLVPADVAGYNYILQNPVEEHRANYPQRCAIGSEETSGCGSRGVYFDDRANGRMAALNRAPNGPDSVMNCIERGWKFYDERPWLGGLFYWTGFDYRGEPNPLSFPATGSEFGIFDYCGFPKDEAYYLKSWWDQGGQASSLRNPQPVLHIFPHWNLAGHEGETIDLWAYSNCDEVELRVNGKNLGRKAMPRNGHLSWTVVYKPGYVEAIGYKGGKKVARERIETTGAPADIRIEAVDCPVGRDGRKITVYNVSVVDSKGRFVPDACVPLTVKVSDSARILGVGNGDPSFHAQERPADPDARTFTVETFNGLAQILIDNGVATITADL